MSINELPTGEELWVPKESQAKQDEVIVNENFDVGKRRGLAFDHQRYFRVSHI